MLIFILVSLYKANNNLLNIWKIFINIQSKQQSLQNLNKYMPNHKKKKKIKPVKNKKKEDNQAQVFCSLIVSYRWVWNVGGMHVSGHVWFLFQFGLKQSMFYYTNPDIHLYNLLF